MPGHGITRVYCTWAQDVLPSQEVRKVAEEMYEIVNRRDDFR